VAFFDKVQSLQGIYNYRHKRERRARPRLKLAGGLTLNFVTQDRRNARCVLSRFLCFFEVRNVFVARESRTISKAQTFVSLYFKCFLRFLLALTDLRDLEKRSKQRQNSKRREKRLRRVFVRSLSTIFLDRVVGTSFPFENAFLFLSWKRIFFTSENSKPRKSRTTRRKKKRLVL
jgi:hypothetical protein